MKRAFYVVLVFILTASYTLFGADYSENITVVGTIDYVDDQTALDGPVTINLQLENGSIEILIFGSLYTPTASRERDSLYNRVVATLNIGDQVRASGPREKDGTIWIEMLEVL
jgi:hypothetical protein